MPARTDHPAEQAIDRSPGSLYRQPEATSDPRNEAARWLDAELGGRPAPALFIVIGMGDGQLLDVLDRRAPDSRILVVEPDREAARRCSTRRDWTAWRNSGRLTQLVGPDYAGADGAWRIFPAASNGYSLLAHPRLVQGPEMAAAAAVVKKILFGVRANADAKRRFAPRYLSNVLSNVPSIVSGHDVRVLAGAYTGVPALITAAGPSLDRTMDDVARLQSRALVIATDTTLRPLLGAGITPHLAVGADPSPANARHFRELPDRSRTWLVAESAMDAAAADAFPGRTLWFRLANHHPWPWLRSLGVDIKQLEMWGSVLTAAFEVACLAGCNPIVITGADLAFTDGRPYCRGTTYEFDWAYDFAGGMTLEASWARQTARKQLHHLADVSGTATVTTPALLSFRDWMVARAAASGRRVVNATGGGILYGAGIEQGSLAAAIGDRDIVPIESIAGRPPQPPTSLQTSLVEIAAALDAGNDATEPLLAWREFSGDAFDSSQIRTALKRAAGELTGAPRRSRAVIPWSRLTSSAASVLARLPHSRSGGQAAVDDVPANALVDALAMLDAIVTAAKDAPELRRSTTAGVAAIALQYEWSDGIRWAVQIFEGLMGRASADVMPVRRDPAFFCPLGAQQDPATDDSLPAITSASLRLACEWILAAFGSGDRPAADTEAFAARLSGFRPAARRTQGGTPGGMLQLSASTVSASTEVEIDLPIAPADATRVLTGAMRAGRTSDVQLFTATSGDVQLSATLTFGAARSGVQLRPLMSTPVVLTSRDLPRSLIAYATAEGAVCIAPYARESRLVRPDGSSVTHHSWPHPAVGELPFGDNGAVAWDNGMAGVRPGQAHVMYRDRPGGNVSVEPLSIRPTIGVWWNGRIYWSCYPTPAGDRACIASWAPGEDVRLELPEVTAFGLLAAADALDIHPCVFLPHAGFDSRPIEEGVRLHASGSTTRFALDADGPCSDVAAATRWTASAHPQSHTVKLTTADGASLWMICHAPLRLAWSDESLLVSTVDREMLLFEQLAVRLDSALTGTAPPEVPA